MVKIFDKIKTFAYLGTSSTRPADKTAATATITNELISYLLTLSSFNTMPEEDIYEQLYVWEPEIGGSIDRISTMVGESYKYCCLKGESSEIHEKMVNDANRIADEIDIRNYLEIFSELLMMHGNLFLENKKLSLVILPNKYVTIIDKKERLLSYSGSGISDQIIMEPNFLVLYEGDSSQRVLNRDQFIHVKYKGTPVFSSDIKGRLTYGIYSPSPLHRTVLPVWWKRLTMIVDIMWRFMNVPREHHSIDASLFSYDKYPGTLAQKREASIADAKAFLAQYTEELRRRMPDQGYATLNTVEIKKLDNRSSSHLQTNDLIDQINNQIWNALNVPRSMISGESQGSYASELVIAGYISQKVLHIAERLKPIIVDIIRERLRVINNNYPVEDLDIFMDIDIAVTDLEKFRQMAIMKELGVFTEDEIREYAQYKPLRDDQRDKVIAGKMPSETTAPVGKIRSPETPQSDIQHSTDIGQNKYKSKEKI